MTEWRWGEAPAYSLPTERKESLTKMTLVEARAYQSQGRHSSSTTAKYDMIKATLQARQIAPPTIKKNCVLTKRIYLPKR